MILQTNSSIFDRVSLGKFSATLDTQTHHHFAASRGVWELLYLNYLSLRFHTLKLLQSPSNLNFSKLELFIENGVLKRADERTALSLPV
jgi:hypothetical protein